MEYFLTMGNAGFISSNRRLRVLGTLGLAVYGLGLKIKHDSLQCGI